MTSNSNPLRELARKINAGHKKVLESYRASVKHAREVGLLLVDARELVEHGEWQPWVKRNCRFSYETATNYIKVAKRWKEVERNLQRIPDLTYSGAIKLLVKRKPKPKPQPHTEQADQTQQEEAAPAPAVGDQGENFGPPGENAAPAPPSSLLLSGGAKQVARSLSVKEKLEQKMQAHGIVGSPDEFMALLGELGVDTEKVAESLLA